jgi:hypothetical protein
MSLGRVVLASSKGLAMGAAPTLARGAMRGRGARLLPSIANLFQTQHRTFVPYSGVSQLLQRQHEEHQKTYKNMLVKAGRLPPGTKLEKSAAKVASVKRAGFKPGEFAAEGPPTEVAEFTQRTLVESQAVLPHIKPKTAKERTALRRQVLLGRAEFTDPESTKQAMKEVYAQPSSPKSRAVDLPRLASQKPTDKDLDVLNQQMIEDRDRWEIFYKDFDKFIKEVEQIAEKESGGNDIQKRLTILNAVEIFLFEGSGQTEGARPQFNAQELEYILEYARKMEGWDSIVTMEEIGNPEFMKNPIVLELMATAKVKGNLLSPQQASLIADIVLEIGLRKIITESTYSVYDQKFSYQVYHSIKGKVDLCKKQAAKNMLSVLQLKAEGQSDEQIEEKMKRPVDEIQFVYRRHFPGELETPEVCQRLFIDSLTSAIVWYGEAFKTDYDPRYGCRLIHLLLELGSIDAAIGTAALTQMGGQRDEAVASDNFAAVRGYLESLYVLRAALEKDSPLKANILMTDPHFQRMIPENLDEKIAAAELKLLSLCNTPELIGNALLSMQTLAEHIPEEVEGMIDKLKLLDPYLAVLVPFPTGTPGAITLDITQTLKTQSDVHVDCSMKMGGFIPAYIKNSYDTQFFSDMIEIPLTRLVFNLPEKLLEKLDRNNWKTFKDISASKEKGISDKEAFEVFNAVIDVFLRERFSVDKREMEILTSTGHKEFEGELLAMFKLMAIPSTSFKRKELEDTRTNIANTLILGLGDCRGVTLVKQLTFDIWRKSQCNTQIAIIHDSLRNFLLDPKKSSLESVSGAAQTIKDMDSHTMRIYECVIDIPVAKDKEGHPLFKEINGRKYMVKNESGRPVFCEEHALNVYFDLDKDGKAKGYPVLKDGFYQSTFDFADCTVDDKGHAGAIEMWNPKTESLEKVQVKLRPTHYKPHIGTYSKRNIKSRIFGIEAVEVSPEWGLDPIRQAAIARLRKRALEWTKE